jgi:hypothetical protein
MVDAREHMVLNLLVQATTEVPAEQTIRAKVLPCDNLVLQKIRIARVRGARRQVVNLRIDHEHPTENCDRHYSPYHSLPKRKRCEGPHEHTDHVEHPTDDVRDIPAQTHLTARNGTVVVTLHIRPHVVPQLHS